MLVYFDAYIQEPVISEAGVVFFPVSWNDGQIFNYLMGSFTPRLQQIIRDLEKAGILGSQKDKSLQSTKKDFFQHDPISGNAVLCERSIYGDITFKRQRVKDQLDAIMEILKKHNMRRMVVFLADQYMSNLSKIDFETNFCLELAVDRHDGLQQWEEFIVSQYNEHRLRSDSSAHIQNIALDLLHDDMALYGWLVMFQMRLQVMLKILDEIAETEI